MIRLTNLGGNEVRVMLAWIQYWHEPVGNEAPRQEARTKVILSGEFIFVRETVDEVTQLIKEAGG